MRRARPPLLWLRLEHEVAACPGCASTRIRLLDVFKIARDARGRRMAFVTGCRDCGLLFANPLPTPEELEHQYAPDGDWVAGRKARAAKSSSVGRARDPRDVLLDALAPYVPARIPPPGATVLDVGCGDGKFLDRLQDAGWTTCGIEPSTSVAFVRHRRFVTPPQDGGFDFAILHHVLEHVTEPLAILRQIAGALRAGGVLFVGVPRLDTLAEHGDFKYCLDGRRHLICLSQTCLTGLLARAGFGVTAILDAPALDRELTHGKPLRLRIVATRTATPPALTGRAAGARCGCAGAVRPRTAGSRRLRAPSTTLLPSQRWIPLEADDEIHQSWLADDVEHGHDLAYPRPHVR